MIFELGGKNLAKSLYEVKGEFVSNQRVYRMHHLPLYDKLRKNPRRLPGIIRDVLHALAALSDQGIVHGDLKTENLLIDESINTKVIDFGSAHFFAEEGSVSATTPEYMPPEALKPNAQIQDLAARSHPWSWDIWALGIIILEIAMGFPVWFSLNTVGNIKGALGVGARDPSRIRA